MLHKSALRSARRSVRQSARRPSILAWSVALACAAPYAVAATFEGQVSGDGMALITSAPAPNVSGNASTARSGNSSYEGDVSSGFSRVSAISDASNFTSTVALLTFTQTVTNPYATAQAVSFDFHIPRSRVMIDLGSGTNFQTFNAAASFGGNIRWGGTELWAVNYGISGMGSVTPSGGGSIQAGVTTKTATASAFQINAVAGSPIFLNTNGDDVGLAGDGYISSEDYLGTLDLGVMAGGETKELVYVLVARASFEATYRDASAAAAYGYGGFAQAGGFDPFAIQFTPDANGNAVQLNFTTPVPEAQTYAMFLGGLALLAARLRKR